MGKVKLLGQISGTRDGEEWPPHGSIVELPDDEADDLVKVGQATRTEHKVTHPDFAKPKKGTVERATAGPNDQATAALQANNAALGETNKALQAENEKLRAQLAESATANTPSEKKSGQTK